MKRTTIDADAYAQARAAVMKIVAKLPCSNAELADLIEPARPLGSNSRLVDRVLQGLRMAGQIVYVRGKWHPADRVPCTHCKGRGFVATGRPAGANRRP